MSLTLAKGLDVLGILLLLCAWNLVPAAHATSCTTQSQMTPAEREAFSRTAVGILSDVQSGNVESIRDDSRAGCGGRLSGTERFCRASETAGAVGHDYRRRSLRS